jgi:hypothetical protein
MAEPVVAVDTAVAAVSRSTADLRAGLQPPPFSRFDVLAEAEDAVGLVAEEVGLDHQAGDGARVLLRHAERARQRATKPQSSAGGTGLATRAQPSPCRDAVLVPEHEGALHPDDEGEEARPTRLR